MQATDNLVKAYVQLDRYVYYKETGTNAFADHCAKVKAKLRECCALEDFDTLVKANADANELFWLLGGCAGLPGASIDLKETMRAIRKAIETFKWLEANFVGSLLGQVGPTNFSWLRRHLEATLSTIEAAKSGFGRRTHWFLNIAKARLVVHVLHHTDDLHDKEISSLVAAMTDSSYDATAQNRWRHAHAGLICDSIDPTTVMSPADRERGWIDWQEVAAGVPEFDAAYRQWTVDFNRLSAIRKLPARAAAAAA
jgi:hypothetical protein